MSDKVPAKRTDLETAILKYNLKEATLNKLSKDCMAVTVMDPDDKKGYAIAHKLRMKVKEVRITVEKTRKELKAKAIIFGKGVEAEANRLKDILIPLEDYLLAQEKIVDDEKERQKEKKAEELKQRIRTRVDILLLHGMVFDGVDTYNFLTLSITQMEVSGLTDKLFDLFAGKLEVEFDEESERLFKEDEEKLRIQKEKDDEQALIKMEQDEEAEKLVKQKTEQEEKEAKIKDAQDKIKADQKVIDDEKQKVKDDAAQKIRDDDATALAEKNAKETAAAKALQDKKDEEEKVEKEKVAEDLRKALLPDNEKLKALASEFKGIAIPSLSYKESHETLDAAMKLVHEACKLLVSKVLNGKTE